MSGNPRDGHNPPRVTADITGWVRAPLARPVLGAAVLSPGMEKSKILKMECTRYLCSSDPFDGGRDEIYGLDIAVMQLVDFFRCVAEGYETAKRILLLHGPVGSSKSTIARLLKKG